VNIGGAAYACVQGWGIFSHPTTAASVAAIKTWHANAVRIPLNEDCWLAINGVSPAYSGTAYRQAVINYVNLLNQNGVYAILNLMYSAPGTTLATTYTIPMPDKDHSPAFWSSVATAFRGNDRVIFEPFNEPHPDSQRNSTAAWVCWRDGGVCPGVPFEAAGMQSLVDAIRATGATNVIALDGVSYSNALGQWMAYKPNDPLNNLAAVWHVYNFMVCSSVSCIDSTVGVLDRQVPVIATEIGVNNCDPTFFNMIMNWLDAHGDSYLAWVWDTWGGACSSIALIADYSGTPTTYGQIYRTHLLAFP
jgi:hypothetical protein